MRYQKILALLPALLLCAVPTFADAAVDVSFTVNVAPPPLPVYEQPPLPAPGYIWTPGYWAWDGSDYYWVPGTWVLPPVSDMLWTPGYWGWRDGFYGWNPGYWGTEVGFYGGIDYGFGYPGVGFRGGYWHGGAFFYNRAVANFGRVTIVNVYNAPTVRHGVSRVSFNGGQGGVRARPNLAERRAMSEQHREPTAMQREHAQGAAGMPAMHRSQNGGHPQILTTQRPGDFAHPGPGLHNHQQPAEHGAAAQIHQEPQRAAPQIREEPQRSQGAGPAMRGPSPQSAGPAMRGPVGRPNGEAHGQFREQPREQPHEQPPGGQAPHAQAPHEQAPRPQAAHEGSHQPERREPEQKDH